MSSSLMSARSASVLAQMATTGALLGLGVGAQPVQVGVVLEAGLADVADEHRRLGRDQAQRLQDDTLFLAEIDAAHRLRLVQRGLALLEHLHQRRGFLVVARARGLHVAVQALFHRGQVGQAELGLDDLDVGDRVHPAGHVDHVVVVETAHHVDDGVGLADVAQELVAQALALAGPGHQAGDVDELDDGRHHTLRLHDGRQLRQPRVGHLDHADVGLDGAERVVLGRDAGLGERVEEGGLADVRQSDDAALEAHRGLSLGSGEPAILRAQRGVSA